MDYKITRTRVASDGLDVDVLSDDGERMTVHWPTGSEPANVDEAVAARMAELAIHPPEVAGPDAETLGGDYEAVVSELAATKAELAKAVADLAAATKAVK